MKKKSVLKSILKVVGIVLGVILLIAVGLFGYLTITEYRPADTEAVELKQTETAPVFSGNSFRVLSWNIGYSALGKESDFFMDGGKQTRPDNEGIVNKNLDGIKKIIADANPDFCLLQEVDSDSDRSFKKQEVDALTALDFCRSSAYAFNYKCDFVPYPLPPLGRVRSGLLTMSAWKGESATRISLPCPFKWPISTANLKRCLLVDRIPLEGSDKELVLVNLHLEAYDDGEGKIAQTNELLGFLRDEYAKGNYVVAGGDWNQIFPDTESIYPIPEAMRKLWSPGVLEQALLEAGGWELVWDPGEHGTCRLLNQPYDPGDRENTQYYVIDGFLISPNLELVSVKTLNEEFEFSDHNPVLAELRFAGAQK